MENTGLGDDERGWLEGLAGRGELEPGLEGGREDEGKFLEILKTWEWKENSSVFNPKARLGEPTHP